MVYDNGRLVGTMSVLIRPLPMGFSVMYAPRGPVCDRNDPFVMASILSAADDLAAQVNALELMTDPDEPCTNQEFRELMSAWDFWEREDTGFDNIQAQYVFRLPLAGRTEEEVFEKFSSKTRYNIRLAQRKGVQIRAYLGNEKIPETVLEAFTVLMEQTGERDHFIAREKEYYRRVFASLGQEAVLFMACLDGQPIAGTIGVFSGRKGWYLYGASGNAHRNVMPNYLLQWKMIQWAIARQCVFYDFRGVPGILTKENPLYGLYRFKKGFGGDYTKLTGLFLCRYRPALAWCFENGLKLFRKLRAWKRCR